MNETDSRNKTYLRQLVVFMLLIIAFPLSAEERGDSLFTFRFYLGRDGFYAPGMNNGEELRKLYECVDKYKEELTGSEGTVYVDGYSNANKSRVENLLLAKIRSNRVKSELITNKGLKERNFSTRNHVGEGNFVTVRINLPKESVISTPEKTLIEEPVKTDTLIEKVIVSAPEVTDTVWKPTSEAVEVDEPEEKEISSNKIDEVIDSRFALKTNLLFYALLMPNIEVEMMVAKRWSVALEGQCAWWTLGLPHKVYRVATIMPEGRFWVIEHKRWHGMYVGVFGGIGEYDLDWNDKGHEGEGFLVGASAGYMWPVSKHLSLEGGIGVGFMRTRDKSYRPHGGHYIYQTTKNFNYFGPLRLKLSLVWRIPK